jgi:ABC-2 type transport system permease protein
LRRVRSKWFVITTVLGPVLLFAMMAIPPVIGIMASGTDEQSVALVDETNVLAAPLAARSDPRLTFVPVDASAYALRAEVEAGRYDGFLVLPDGILEGGVNARYYSVEGGGFTMESRLERALNEVVIDHRLGALNVSPDVRAIMASSTGVRLLKITEEGTAADSAAASSLLGMMMGFVIYIAMIIYGAYVMHGVMEEKQSRVLEIVVSSVRPFELLMGKVLGIGAMGLLQMGVWAAFLLILTLSAGGIAAIFLDPSDFNLPEGVSGEDLAAAADIGLPQMAPELFVWFLLFFLGGYLLYSSLFAAIGSTVEHQQDAQGLMFPVTILIIIPMLFISVIVESPNSTLAIALSMIPFFSPVLMVLRIAVTEVPFWQALLAFLLLCATFVGAIWICGRIYRVGILMYGKKPTLRDLARWLRYQ